METPVPAFSLQQIPGFVSPLPASDEVKVSGSE